jgi:hypothetical protein
MDVGGLRTSWHNRAVPRVDVSFYTLRGQEPVLTPSGPEVTITDADLASGQVSVPLRLAFRNRDGRRLELVRVKLSYPRDLTVSSTGRARIDTSNRTLVYEHELGTLESTETFAPLPTLDTLTISHEFSVFAVLALTKDRFPIYTIGISGVPDRDRLWKVIEFEVQAFFRDRPPVTVPLRLRIGPSVDVNIVDPPDGHFESLKPQDAQMLGSTAHDERLAAWQKIYPDTGQLIGYEKVRRGKATVQLIRVAGLLCRVNVDENSDGFIDFQLWATEGAPMPTRRFVPNGRSRMIDWVEDSIR